MNSEDIEDVSSLAATIHPLFPESPSVFKERQKLYPHGCQILEQNEKAKGYLLSHPWSFGDIPALNVLLRALPQFPTTYYIHDLALLPEMRGSGMASSCIETLISNIRTAGFPCISLVSVNKSSAFWNRFGFQSQNNASLEKKLLSYGTDASFMVRKL